MNSLIKELKEKIIADYQGGEFSPVEVCGYYESLRFNFNDLVQSFAISDTSQVPPLLCYLFLFESYLCKSPLGVEYGRYLSQLLYHEIYPNCQLTESVLNLCISLYIGGLKIELNDIKTIKSAFDWLEIVIELKQNNIDIDNSDIMLHNKLLNQINEYLSEGLKEDEELFNAFIEANSKNLIKEEHIFLFIKKIFEQLSSIEYVLWWLLKTESLSEVKNKRNELILFANSTIRNLINPSVKNDLEYCLSLAIKAQFTNSIEDETACLFLKKALLNDFKYFEDQIQNDVDIREPYKFLELIRKLNFENPELSSILQRVEARYPEDKNIVKISDEIIFTKPDQIISNDLSQVPELRESVLKQEKHHSTVEYFRTIYEGYILKTYEDIKDPAYIEREISILETISQFAVPNNCLLKSHSHLNQEKKYVIIEYFEKTLQDIITENKTNELFILSIARALSDSLSLLESLNIFHLNIQPQNIVIDTNGQPKLLFFSIAGTKLEHDYESIYQNNPYENINIAPEIIEILITQDYNRIFSRSRADVFSLGITLLQTYYSQSEDLAQVNFPENREKLKSKITDIKFLWLKQLLSHMLADEYKRRPSFKTCYEFLSRVLIS